MTFDVYSDPAHAWCKVKRELVKDLNISPYSYQRGDFVYLEEDRDLSLFMSHMKDKEIEVKFREHHTDRSSRIRNYESYRKN